jgi:PAS domain S-box-containing protein
MNTTSQLVSQWMGLKDFFSQSKNIYFAISDAEGRFLYLNETWSALGYDIEKEMLGKSFREFVLPDYRDKVRDEALPVIRGENFMGRVRNAYKKKNGGLIYLDWQFVFDRSEGRAYSMALDVTHIIYQERLSALRARMSQEYISSLHQEQGEAHFFNCLLQLLLEELHCPFGFIGLVKRDIQTGQPYLKTYALTDISWDEASRALFERYKSQGMEFRNLNTLFGQVLRDGQHLMTNEPATHPARGGLPPGHPSLHSFWGIPIYHAGEMIAMIGVANREGGFYQELIDIYQELFDHIGQLIRSAELLREVQQQRSLLSHQSRLAAIGELASGVGHEINNPLAIITGQISLLRSQLEKNLMGPEPGELINRLGKMEKAAGRIKAIVQGLRNLSRSEKVSQDWFSFSQMVCEVVETLSELYHADGVRILAEIDQGWESRGHLGRWQQVLINLLNNARDAILEGRGRSRDIHVRLRPGIGSQQFIVEVKDLAGGIPEAVQKKIFDPFFTTKPAGKGTGLGLALVQTIVQEHKARLELESREGEGTTFRLILDGRNAQAHMLQAKSGEDSQSSSSFAQGKESASTKEAWSRLNLSIAVVDDERELLEAMGEILRSVLPKSQISCFDKPDQLLVTLKQNTSFDLILTDYKMPGLNGVNLGAQLRDLGYQGALVLMTGEVNIDLLAGFDGVLNKPFSEDEMIQGLNVWTQGGKLGRAGQQQKKAS